ncbi:MAG: N-acetyltransferase [Chitinophagaceae bacterium]|nr:MAG: N-acetyltransferase [Chitinophagaceae bacterium]
MPAVITTTERLIIRQLEVGDAVFMLEIVNSPGWLKYIGDRNVHSVEDAVTYLEKGAITSYTLNGFGLWMVEQKHEGSPVGLCGLIRRPGLEDVDLGFALLPGKEGNGYALEAAVACVAQAKLSGIEKLVAITTPGNASSIRLLGKLGFAFTGQVTLPGSTEVLNLYSLPLA